MSGEKLFSEMYVVPRYLYDDLKKVLNEQQVEDLKKINKEHESHLDKNDDDSSMSESKISPDLDFSSSQIPDVNHKKISEDSSQNEQDLNHSPILKGNKNKRGPWKLCPVDGCNKNLKGFKKLEEHINLNHADYPKFSSPKTIKKKADVSVYETPIKSPKLNRSYFSYTFD